MWRFKIKGVWVQTFTLDDDPGEVYVDAPDAESAVAKAKRDPLLSHVDSVTRVPWDEGRGPLWRLARWLGIV